MVQSVETTELTLRLPDDWHLHLRDGEVLTAVLPDTVRHFGRAIVMPNLRPPVVTADQIAGYRDRILAAVPSGMSFEPLMTAYVTSSLTPDQLRESHARGLLAAAKLYPAHATTNSDAGLVRIEDGNACFETLQELGLPLLVHGEVTDSDVDVFDREKVFIDRHLAPLVERFPNLKVVFEHITTQEAVQFVREAREGVAATITPHHIELSRNDLFAGGLRPHHYCLPVAKRAQHRDAVRRAACSGHPRFFLGTDSAPHLVETKETDCGCAGIYSAPTALSVYAEVFEREGALDRLEAFASLHGPAFYGRPPHEERIRLVRRPPSSQLWREAAGSRIRVYRGESLSWSVERGDG
jgi:dihydroorotase